MYEQSAPAQPTTQLPPDENKGAGTVGAFLFALAGGLAFYLLYQVGKLAAISGIIGVSCALVATGCSPSGRAATARSLPW